MLLASMCIVAAAAGARTSTFDDGIELRDVTLSGKVHFLVGFDSPFTYAVSPTRDQFAYVPRVSGNPTDELRISELRARPAVVVHTSAPVYDVAWAPAGRPIAMATSDGIWLVEPDGSGLHRVAGYGSGLAWSPDSHELAMYRREPGNRLDTIRVLTIATGAVRDVAEGTGPSWSPDGSSLLYGWSDNMAHQPDEVRVVAAGGGTPRTIAYGYGGTWSPDGKRIAFVHSQGNSPAGVWVIPSAGGAARLVAPGGGAPMWLPNSRRITFIREHRSARCGRRTTVSVVPARGGKVSRVLASKSLVQPLAWNPKGTKLLYVKYLCA